ncbi:SMI1/KNR4 family protein [Lentzea sp. NPDC051838]|uniref:SMI1/KNR4 family protein n=1 Tax=Lentzea sp. NPDC051838 TaxID=3154849 RepID=UPI003421BE70
MRRHVDELVTLLGWEPGDHVALGWQEAERRLGFVFPEDYKRLMTVFGTGLFDDFVALVSPAEDEVAFDEFERDFAEALELAGERVARGTLPHRLFPQPGGLIPWGGAGDGVTLFWRTDSGGPDDWTVVYCDDDFSRWEEYQGDTSAFLLDLLAGRITSDLLGFEPVEHPEFTPAEAEDEEPKPPPAPNPKIWQAALGNRKAEPPHDLTAELASVTRVAAGESEVDWSEVEGRLGFRFPGDYKAVADHFGPGDFLGIRLVVPGAAGQDFRFERLAEDVLARVRAKRPIPAPFFPESGGVIPWGYTVSGHTFFWVPLHENPDEWPVIMLFPGFGAQAKWGLTASSLLLAHVSGRGKEVGMLPDPAQIADPGRPLFVAGR